MSNDKPKISDTIREAKQFGDIVSIDLWYPQLDTQTVKAIVVGLVDVRAADDLHISYDFERDGWSIKMRRRPAGGKWETDDECPYEEVSFIHPWLEGKEPANPVKVEASHG